MREKLTHFGFVALLLVPAGAAVACDQEDRRDVEEVGDEIDKEVDQLDKDGKDD